MRAKLDVIDPTQPRGATLSQFFVCRSQLEGTRTDLRGISVRMRWRVRQRVVQNRETFDTASLSPLMLLQLLNLGQSQSSIRLRIRGGSRRKNESQRGDASKWKMQSAQQSRSNWPFRWSSSKRRHQV